jgi:hypothetical protein
MVHDHFKKQVLGRVDCSVDAPLEDWRAPLSAHILSAAGALYSFRHVPERRVLVCKGPITRAQKYGHGLVAEESARTLAQKTTTVTFFERVEPIGPGRRGENTIGLSVQRNFGPYFYDQ